MSGPSDGGKTTGYGMKTRLLSVTLVCFLAGDFVVEAAPDSSQAEINSIQKALGQQVRFLDSPRESYGWTYVKLDYEGAKADFRLRSFKDKAKAEEAFSSLAFPNAGRAEIDFKIGEKTGGIARNGMMCRIVVLNGLLVWDVGMQSPPDNMAVRKLALLLQEAFTAARSQ